MELWVLLGVESGKVYVWKLGEFLNSCILLGDL